MKPLLKVISLAALACIIVPPILYLVSAMGKPAMINLMLVGTVLWFATVPFWMGKKA